MIIHAPLWELAKQSLTAEQNTLEFNSFMHHISRDVSARVLPAVLYVRLATLTLIVQTDYVLDPFILTLCICKVVVLYRVVQQGYPGWLDVVLLVGGYIVLALAIELLAAVSHIQTIILLAAMVFGYEDKWMASYHYFGGPKIQSLLVLLYMNIHAVSCSLQPESLKKKLLTN